MKYLAKITSLSNEDYKELGIDTKRCKTDEVNIWYESDNYEEVDRIEECNTKRYYEEKMKKDFEPLITFLSELNKITDLGNNKPTVNWRIEKSYLFINGNHGALGNLYSLLCYFCKNYAIYLTSENDEDELKVLYLRG